MRSFTSHLIQKYANISQQASPHLSSNTKSGNISEKNILDLFVFIWICLNYLVYFPIAYVLYRWVYTFYFTQTVPAIALSLPRSLWEDRVGKSILVMVVSIQLWWLFIWFPVKSELHVSILKSLGLPA